jgi:arylsulfatase A-like enzyme
MSRAAALAILPCLLAALACQPASEDWRPFRFIDQIPVDRFDEITIDGDTRDVLPPVTPEQRIAVIDAPERPVLTFSVGIRPFQGPGVVRFEILLEPKPGEPETLYRKEIDSPGWIDERIDLSTRDLNGSTMVFRRTTVKDFEGEPPLSAWGNPTLVPAAPSSRPSVILVSLDTLQADRLGSYGNQGARTPALDRLAAEGVLYERTYSPSTWTAPSHASLFYGAYLQDTPTMMRAKNMLPEKRELPERPIASILRNAGYLTAGFTGGGYLAYPWDFKTGFETYFAYPQPPQSRDECDPRRFDGAEVFRRATEWLHRNGDQPFFLFVQTYDVHDRCPFLLPKPPDLYSWPYFSPKKRLLLHRYYDYLIARVDRRMAAFLATIDQLGLRENTLLIVTSDHGEVLTANRINGHGCNNKTYSRSIQVPLPYEELTKVPLVVRFPGRVPDGERVSTPVSLVDVPATLLALLGLPSGPNMQGDLLPGLGLSGAREASEPIYSHCGEDLAVWRGSYKLLTTLDGRRPDQFYDVSRDPNEQTPLNRDSSPVFDVLTADAEGFWKGIVRPGAPGAAGAEPELDEAAKRRLRALGYLE